DGALVQVPLVGQGKGEFIALLYVRGGMVMRGDKLAGPGADEGLEFFQMLVVAGQGFVLGAGQADGAEGQGKGETGGVLHVRPPEGETFGPWLGCEGRWWY